MSVWLETRDCDMGFSGTGCRGPKRREVSSGGGSLLSLAPTPPPPRPPLSLFHHSPCVPSFLSTRLSAFSPPSPALPSLPGLSVDLRQQVWQKTRLSRKTRGLRAHKFHAVQHANVPSADKRAFNPAALLLSTPLPLSLLSLCYSTSLPHSLVLFFSSLCFLFRLCDSLLHQSSFISHLSSTIPFYSFLFHFLPQFVFNSLAVLFLIYFSNTTMTFCRSLPPQAHVLCEAAGGSTVR